MRRSFWGWGWEERLPDEAAREALGTQMAAMLGTPAPDPRPLPTLEQAVAGVPRPAVAPPSAIADLCDASPEARLRHAYGRAYRDLVRGFTCDFSAAPDFVCLPRSEEDVARALEACASAGIAVAPYGGGTSVVGGVEAGGRGRPACSLDLGPLSRVLEVDAVSRAARIQAGALGPDLEAQLRPHGLTLRHFPQSFEFSTFGGWIATRAGGHFATLYTRIDDLVESVRLITPTGVWSSRRLPSSGAGPSPDRLALGAGHRAGGLVPGELPPPRSHRGAPQRRCPGRGGAVARLRIGRSPARAVDVARACARRGRGRRLPARRLVPRRRREGAGRRIRSLARGVLRRTLLAERAGIAGHHRGHLRDRLHLGSLRGASRPRLVGDERCAAAGVWRGHPHLPLHARLSRRPRAVLHVPGPGPPRKRALSVGRTEGGGVGGGPFRRRHHHAPPRRRAHAPSLVRPRAPGTVRRRAARRKTPARPRGYPEPRRPARLKRGVVEGGRTPGRGGEEIGR